MGNFSTGEISRMFLFFSFPNTEGINSRGNRLQKQHFLGEEQVFCLEGCNAAAENFSESVMKVVEARCNSFDLAKSAHMA